MLRTIGLGFLWVVAIALPLSPLGFVYLGVTTGLVARHLRRKDSEDRRVAPRWLRRALVGALVATLALVEVAARFGELAHDKLAVAVIDEADIALPVASLLPLVEPDARGLRRSMGAAYRDMRKDVGVYGTPVFASWAGQNATLSMKRDGDLGVVFLHGWAGNFALPCWQVAQAAANAGGSTLCPSGGFDARWQRHEDRVRAAIARLRADGKRHIVLAGISAGGIGASRLAPRLRRQIDGVLLIAGASRHAGPPRVPVLTIGGDRDTMTSPVSIRRYGRRYGRHVALEGGHFALLEEPEVAHDAMVAFFQRVQGRATPRARPDRSRRRARSRETRLP
ncbi:MAG: hypothetical protein AAGE52_04525 [Myxococcota bacterium]